MQEKTKLMIENVRSLLKTNKPRYQEGSIYAKLFANIDSDEKMLALVPDEHTLYKKLKSMTRKLSKGVTIRQSAKRFQLMKELMSGGQIEKLKEHYSIKDIDRVRRILKEVAEAQRSLVTVAKKEGSKVQQLIGCEQYIEKINELVTYGNKAIFLGGYHGLGKTSMVYYVAELQKAEVIRLQVTELLSEVDIIGGVDLKSGEFLFSEFVNKIIEANENPDKKYFILLDEFTRGREEALNILFPVLAEKTMYINSAYSKIKELPLGSNITVFGTGNVKDKGLREVGEAEFDRWNGIEVFSIRDKGLLKTMIEARTQLRDLDIIYKLIDFYLLSWSYGEEARILPMSHRTLIESANIISRKMQNGMKGLVALTNTIEQTYYITSQAILNPNFKNTFVQMKREVLK